VLRHRVDAKAFGHDPKITLEQGIPKTVEWMKKIYADTIKVGR